MANKAVVPKEPKLTVKRRRWIKEYIRTGNATEAAERVYSCKNRGVASAIGSENLRKLAISDLMEKMGLTDVALINIGTEGMTKAKKIHGTGDNFVETPDYATRHKYWETLLKLKGKLSGKGTAEVDANLKRRVVAEEFFNEETD
jgi:hypothetical protein